MEALYMFVVVIHNGVYSEDYVREYGMTWEDCSWYVQTYTGEGLPICYVDEQAIQEYEEENHDE